MAEFTGERVIPGQVEPDLWNEHAARYWFAGQYAAGKRVLDAGCGAGYGAYHLAADARTVVGLDLAPEALAYARSNYAGPNLRFVQGSCSSLPFAGAAFDLVVSFEVIEHLADWEDCLSELRRVLAPEGILIISTPNKSYYTESRRESGPNPFHVHEFDYEEFSAALARVFPHVCFLTQNHAAGVLLQPVEPAGEARVAVENTSAEPATANFYLAICSVADVPAPRPFFFVPTAANVLRERERHIAMLTADLDRLRREKQNLFEMFQSQGFELERSNQWAADLDSALTEARTRIDALQNELASEQAQAKAEIARLETEKGDELAACISRLDAAEATVIQRSEWALRLDAENRALQASNEQLQASNEQLQAGNQHLQASNQHLQASNQHLQDSNQHLQDSNEQLQDSNQHLQAGNERLQAANRELQATLEMVKASRWVRLGKSIGVGPLAREQ